MTIIAKISIQASNQRTAYLEKTFNTTHLVPTVGAKLEDPGLIDSENNVTAKLITEVRLNMEHNQYEVVLETILAADDLYKKIVNNMKVDQWVLVYEI